MARARNSTPASRRTQNRGRSLSDKEIRAMLSAQGERAVDLIAETMADTEQQIRTRIDLAKFVINTLLSNPDPVESTDQITRLSEFLRSRSATASPLPPRLTPERKRKEVV